MVVNSGMRLGNSIITARFLKRPNRFTVLASCHGKMLRCYLPNPGRLDELLIPKALLALNHVPSPQRRTKFDVVAIRTGKVWVSVDSRIPNKLVGEALRYGWLSEFLSYSEVKSECIFGDSRIDFLLTSGRGKCLLEVKSCTLVKDGAAFFPDAPTDRGRRHVLALVRARRKGLRASVMFVIQRSDATSFTPNHVTDPAFVDALRYAGQRGVEIIARRCAVQNFQIFLGPKVAVRV